MVHSEYDGEDSVKALLGQGPEPLQSQFVPGYGMALNLLRTRTLPQAADFVQKSFSLYLGTPSGQACSLIQDGLPARHAAQDAAREMFGSHSTILTAAEKQAAVQPSLPVEQADQDLISLCHGLLHHPQGSGQHAVGLLPAGSSGS